MNMECTQRLECTQEIQDSRTERIFTEQIGFLGICGEKYPVKKGPNKIGRDPTTCSIVLNLNSVSRQHAVINILNHNEFMLMDLDSANKTKLMNKTLQPYIPHPLKNGDMVQFGDIFGVFRLLEEENDLPMTQAIDIPDTPISTKYMSKLNKVPITTIPESPDVSDRDDSFIAPSQPKSEKCFRNSTSHFVKPSSNIISIKPIGSNKIDNIYWSSSKKSVSLNSNFDDSNSDVSNLNVSIKENSKQNNDKIYNMETQDPFLIVKPNFENQKDNSIYDMETQAPFSGEKSTDKQCNNNSIYEMETQAPFVSKTSTESKESIYDMQTQVITGDPNDSIDSIYTANTQMPSCSRSIHSLSTQLPGQVNECLPSVYKIDNQHNMQFNLFTSNKNEDDKTSAKIDVSVAIKNDTNNATNKNTDNMVVQCKEINVSEEEIMFEEMDTQDILGNFESQPLLPPADILQEDTSIKNIKVSVTKHKKIYGIDNNADSDTDDEIVAITSPQKITNNKIEEDDDLTDCEDLFVEVPKKSEDKNAKASNIDFEDMLTQVIDEDLSDDIEKNYVCSGSIDNKTISEMPTQVLTIEEKISLDKDNVHNDIKFEDLPTQVIVEDITDNTHLIPQKIIMKQTESPFKIPLVSPKKVKRKDVKLLHEKEKNIESKTISLPDDSNYYAATQDIVNDLCSQKTAPEGSIFDTKGNEKSLDQFDDDELVPCSVEDYKTGQRFPWLESPEKSKHNRSIEISDEEESVGKFVSKLNSDQIKEIIGIQKPVDKVRRVTSDPSDAESTPKKVRPIKFMDIDLPDSQEIKTSVSLYSKTLVTESSSDSEPENDSEEQHTPILFRKNKPKKCAKIDLTKKFDVESLPTRVITRLRKPTSKLQSSDENDKKLSKNILKPKFLTDQEDEIDKDIICENISRLKSKSNKNKSKDIDKKNHGHSNIGGKENENDEEKLEIKAENKTSHSNKDSKANIKTEKKLKIPGLQKVSDEKTKLLETSKIQKSNQRESRRKKNYELLQNEDNVNKDVSQSDTSTKSTRSTRTRRKVNTKEIISVENKTQENKRTSRTRKERTTKPVTIDLSSETTPDVRRSKRQRSSKEKKEDETHDKIDKPKSILKRNHAINLEQSTVYNISSESGTESPKNSKRSASDDLDVPSSKRTRSAAPVLNSTSLRLTPVRMNQTQKILFTAFPCEEVRVKLENLGAVIVTDVTVCTVVLTLQIKRTFKLLCALGLGRPIVGPDWVQACADANMIVDPWLYVLKDEAAEKRFQFNLAKVLRSKRNFLKGFNVSATPSVMPNATEMKLIVECSGGTWKEGGSQWICVSCSADKALWPSLKRKGATVVTTEFILGGVLRQRADITANKL